MCKEPALVLMRIFLLHLDGYNLISKGKSASQHGGVAIYLKNDFCYKVLPLNSISNRWDGLFIEVEASNIVPPHAYKPLIIGNTYRPPRDNLDNYNMFTAELGQINFQSTSKDITMVGNFNIDLFKIRERNVYNDFFEMMLRNGFNPNITFPTRIPSTSTSLIDNIFVKLSSCCLPTSAGILLVNISDHLPCFISLNALRIKRNAQRYIMKRTRSEQAFQNFKNEVEMKCSLNNFNINIMNDPNTNYEKLDMILKEAYEKHLPVKIVKFKRHIHKLNNWMTRGILLSIRFRDKLYKRVINSKNDTTLHQILKIN